MTAQNGFLLPPSCFLHLNEEEKNIGAQCAFTQNGKAIGEMILSRQRAGKEFATHLSSIFPFLIPASNVELPSKRQTQTAG